MGGTLSWFFKGTNFGTHYGLVFKNFLIIGSNSADNVTSSGEGWVELHLKIYSLVQGNVLWNFGTGGPDPKAGSKMVLLETLVV